ncbi:hypothetical protein BST61_g9208 [Cercospora zeina]
MAQYDHAMFEILLRSRVTAVWGMYHHERLRHVQNARVCRFCARAPFGLLALCLPRGETSSCPPLSLGFGACALSGTAVVAALGRDSEDVLVRRKASLSPITTMSNATDIDFSDLPNGNRGPEITITSALMMVAAWIFLGLRLKIRWPWANLAGWDDVAVIAGTLIATAESGTIFRAVHCGLGMHIYHLDWKWITPLRATIKASDILSVIAVCCSKLAVSLLILRLSTFKRHIHAAWITTVAIVIFGFIAVTSAAVTPNDVGLRRAGWILVGAYSIVLEFVLFALPIFLVWPLKLRLAAKLTIVGGFAFRIPATVLCVLRIVAVVRMLRGNPNDPTIQALDFTWNYVDPTLYSAIEMYYSLMAATIPCMHLFLRAFTKDWLRETHAQAGPNARLHRPSAFLISSLRSKPSTTTTTTTTTKKNSLSSSMRSTTQIRDSMTDASLLFRADGGTTAWVTQGLQNCPTDATDKIMVHQTVEVQFDDRPRAAERALLQI